MAMSVKTNKTAPQTVPNSKPVSDATSNVNGKPKGKDFGAMAMRNDQSGGRPKGKDFGAMAARLGAPAPTQQPAHQVQQPPMQVVHRTPPSQQPKQVQQQPLQVQRQVNSAEEARQRQIDAARRAAGYTPVSPRTVNMRHAAAGKLKQQQSSLQLQQAKKQPQSTRNNGPSSKRINSQGGKQETQIQQQKSQTTLHKTHQYQHQSVGPIQTPVHTQSSKTISSNPTHQPKAAEAKIIGPGLPHLAPLVGQRLNDLLHSLDPNYTLDSQAEDEVLRLAQNFLDSVVNKSIRLSQHRGSKTLDVQDVQFVLAKQWGIVVPGLGPPTRPANRAPAAQKRKAENLSTGVPVNKKPKVGL